MWLSLFMNRAGIYFPKETLFLYVMRNQDDLVAYYAWLILILVAAAIVDIPFSKFALRSFIVISTMFLNLRFDVNTGMPAKIDEWKMD